MPFDLDVRDADFRERPRLHPALALWCRAAPKRRVEVVRARVGGAETCTLHRGRSRAHFASVRQAVDALSSPERRSRISWICDGRGEAEGR